ncbi:efflux transporter outer membrane subunit [Sphingomonas sp. CCH5-D11]|uniref:efflux transporter outer membrane subunit n=1 Tax=Sphingomonas sp. CCH5-D11 TaxID=1768786 RepID=UPI00063F2F33|nr:MULTISPECIES: efflux transporter outer membrane subunit [unclassified Sphingomonas]
MRKLVLAGLLPGVLAGCTVGPDYRAPVGAVPPAFREASSATIAQPVDRWWERYGDPALVALVDRAISANGDVAIAEARITQARARADEARGGQLPQLNGQGSTTVRRLSENGEQLANIPTGLVEPDLDYTVYRAGFDASWELDLFGRNRRQVEAAEARLGSVAEARNDTLVRVAGDVARAYADYRAAQRRIVIANETLAAARQTADLTDRLARAGEEAQSEVQRVESLAEESAAALPPLVADAKAALYRLDVLLGAQPGGAEALIAASPTSALRAPDVPVGLPSDLLRRRPDIRRAERELAAATADTGVAVADLYPRFSLTSTLGLEALSIGDLFDSASRYGSLVPGFSLPIFDGGRRRAVVRRQQALVDENLASYNQTVVRALSDVETALLRYRQDRERAERLLSARTRLTRTLELARLRYRAGEASLTDVLDVQRQVSALDDRLAQAEAVVIIDAVSLDKALGGGWQVATVAQADAGAATRVQR